MYQIITPDDLDQTPAYRAAFAALPQTGERHVILTAAPDAAGSWEWLAALHHDLNGALRSFHYLADKARANYDEGDPRGAKVIASIEKHLKTMTTLKSEFVDRLLPWEK